MCYNQELVILEQKGFKWLTQQEKGESGAYQHEIPLFCLFFNGKYYSLLWLFPKFDQKISK